MEEKIYCEVTAAARAVFREKMWKSEEKRHKTGQLERERDKESEAKNERSALRNERWGGGSGGGSGKECSPLHASPTVVTQLEFLASLNKHV